MNAALLATNGADVTIKNATVKSSAQNGNGVFSYGEGTIVNISNSKITTTADNSGGIQTTGGGTTNATLTANNSEALVIEGENSITLTNCDVTGNMSDTKGSSSDENVHNVMIYQSMSGDAKEGTSSFDMTGGTLTSKNGDMFYVTNTHCVLKLSGVDIKNQDSDGYLLNVCGNSASHGWGTAGGTAVSDNAVVTIEKGSIWTLTGDCTLTSLTNNGTINFNGHTITLADGTVLK